VISRIKAKLTPTAPFEARECHRCGLEYHGGYISCASWEGQVISREIGRSHVTGKYCKQRNNCHKCAEVKHKFKTLMHFSGRCEGRTNNKCHVCYENRNSKYNVELMSWYNKDARKKMVVRLYKIMLKGF